MSRCGRNWKRKPNMPKKYLDEVSVLSQCNGRTIAAIAKSLGEVYQVVKRMILILEEKKLVRKEKLKPARGRPSDGWFRNEEKADA